MIPPRPKQTVAQDLLDSLLNLIRNKFYATSGDDARAFAQDRARLLKWVIFMPASWLNKRGITLPADRYKKIFSDIILEAVRHGNTSKVRYRPAWLAHVFQTHFAIHGEEYYAEGKSARALADHILLTAGSLAKAAPAAPDPIAELAAASALLARSRPQKKPRAKESSNLEFNL
jgi:hypothetical protein